MKTIEDFIGIRLDGEGPLHRQIYRAVRGAILDGDLREGTRLPATRRLAAALGVSRNTVLQAFEQLTAEGFLNSRVGSGTHVASPLPGTGCPPDRSGLQRLRRPGASPRWSRYAERIGQLAPPEHSPSPPPRYDFRYGRVDADERLLKLWQRLVSRAAERYPVDYGNPQGTLELRQSLATYLRSRGCRCEPRQILVTNGSQQALDLIARLLINENDHVALEDPGYLGARNAFLSAGAQLRGVPVDDEGLQVDRIPPKCRLTYVTPSHQFPTGAVLSLRRRLALLEWAQQSDGWIIEDDYDGEYRYEGLPIESVQGLDDSGRTLYVGTFSKILFPAARLGYIVLPEALVARFAAAKWWTDRHTPVLEQLALADLINSGEFQRHLRRMRKRYAEQRAALIEALTREFGDEIHVEGTGAGLHVMVSFKNRLPAQIARLTEEARQQDIGLYSAERLFLNQPSEKNVQLLFGYAILTPQEIVEGIRRVVRKTRSSLR
ncbi:MAG: PLP-dependent aminotransferase family protein [Gammaproteobacteria bacterium]